MLIGGILGNVMYSIQNNRSRTASPSEIQTIPSEKRLLGESPVATLVS